MPVLQVTAPLPPLLYLCLQGFTPTPLFPSASPARRPTGASTWLSPSSACAPSWRAWARGQRRAMHLQGLRGRWVCVPLGLGTDGVMPPPFMQGAETCARRSPSQTHFKHALTVSFCAMQMGADSVVRSLAVAALRIAGEEGGSLAGSSHLALSGTPQEPYVNPRHPDARPGRVGGHFTPVYMLGTCPCALTVGWVCRTLWHGLASQVDFWQIFSLVRTFQEQHLKDQHRIGPSFQHCNLEGSPRPTSMAALF